MRLPRIPALATFGWLTMAAAAAWADNICGETVPSNRMVDGIPAYNQCDAAGNGPIYSNNGVDTAAASAGTGWVRTQMSGGYQCTELAHRYLYFRWNVKSVPSGNAGVWCEATLPTGLAKSSTPMHGDLIVFAPGSCGADATTGHVAVVDVVNSNNTITFVEQNRAGRRSCATNTAACFIHVLANDGTDGGVPDSAVSDATPALGPDARSPRDVAPDRGLPDTAGAAGAGGTSGASSSIGSAGRGGAQTSGSSTGGVAGGSTVSAGGQAGQTTSAIPTGGSKETASTLTDRLVDADLSSPTPAEPASSGGCSCALGGGRPEAPLALLLGLLLWRRSRRRSR
jgi:MYXO-CTERM domain-containing protein